jgi:hypothetical protein
MSKHNLALLIDAARLLKPLLSELVFVGGSTTALLITDKAAAEVRPTYDWMPSPRSPRMRHTQIFRNDCGNLVLLRTQLTTEGAPFMPLAPREDDSGCDAP